MTSLLLAAVLSAAAAQKPVVAVTYFENHTNDKDFDVIGKGFADLILTDLVAWDGVDVVERERLHEVIGELDLQQTKYFDPKTRQKIGKLMNATHLLTGNIMLAGGQLQVKAWLRDVKTGKIVAEAEARGTKDQVFDVEQSLVDRLTDAIDVKVKNSDLRRKAKVPSLDALVDYSKALDLSDKGKTEEADAAFKALVSKAPTFLMARDRRAELIKKLDEFKARRADMMTAAAVAVGKEVDRILADETKFDTLSPEDHARHLAAHELKARVLARTLKQHLSWRDGSLRVVLQGHEAPALKLMQVWVENQKRLIDEWERVTRLKGTLVDGVRYPPSLSVKFDDAFVRNLQESEFGEVRLSSMASDDLLRFVLEGRAEDSEKGSFRVAPALGDLDPKMHAAMFEYLDGQVAKHVAANKLNVKHGENDAGRLLELKAEVLMRADRLDDAINVYQQLLDTFPAGRRAKWVEEKIRGLVEGKDNNLRDRERWEKGIRDCTDMDLRVGLRATHTWVWRQGRAGIIAPALALEKACAGKPKTESIFEYVYKSVALSLGRHEDCAGALEYFRKSIDAGGSMSDLAGYQKNWLSWCDLSSIKKGATASRVRVVSPSIQMRNAEERDLSRAAVLVLEDELVARQIGSVPSSSSRGDDRMLWVLVELDGKVPVLSFKLLQSSDEEGAEAGVKEQGGAFSLEAPLAVILKDLRRNSTQVPWKPNAALPLALLEGLVKADALADDKKKDEALATLAALLKKYPGHRTIERVREAVEQQR